jgi:hypothetical protein
VNKYPLSESFFRFPIPQLGIFIDGKRIFGHSPPAVPMCRRYFPLDFPHNSLYNKIDYAVYRRVTAIFNPIGDKIRKKKGETVMRSPRLSRLRPRKPWLLRPFSGRLLALGHILILIALCFFVALFHSEGHAEALLYMETYFSSLGSSAAVLWGVVLGVDWLDRQRS